MQEWKPGHGADTIAELIVASLLAGDKDEAALRAVRRVFPGGATTIECVAWYRGHLRLAGHLGGGHSFHRSARRTIYRAYCNRDSPEAAYAAVCREWPGRTVARPTVEKYFAAFRHVEITLERISGRA